MSKVSIIVAVSLATFAGLAAANLHKGPHHGLHAGHGLVHGGHGLGHAGHHLEGHEEGLVGVPFHHQGHFGGHGGLIEQLETEELEQELFRRGRFHHPRPFRHGAKHHGRRAGLGGVGLGGVGGVRGQHSNFGGVHAADRKNIHGKGEAHNNKHAGLGNQFDTDFSDSVHDDLEGINKQDVVDQEKLIVKESNKGLHNTQGFKNLKGADKHLGTHSAQQAAFDKELGASGSAGAGSEKEFGAEGGSNSELAAGGAHGVGAASL